MKIKKVTPRKESYPIKVMWISNSTHIPSGYAKVTKSICNRLANDPLYDVYTVGMQHTGNPEQVDGLTNIGVVNGQVTESIQEHIAHIRPDVTIILEDPFTMTNLKFHELNLYDSKLLLYFPLDGNNIATDTYKIHRQADMNIGMAKFSTKQLSDLGYNATTIWHGSEINKYVPVNNTIQTKLKLLHGYKEDDIIFYSYFRNSGRKTPQTHMDIMAETLSKLPNDYRYLMHCINADEGSNNLFDYRDRILANKYGKDVIDRIEISNVAVSETVMIQRMQMCDYTIHASSGEGFGIILADSMSCGKICIANNFSTTRELLLEHIDDIGQRGIGVDYDYLLTSSYNVEHGHCNTNKFVDSILNTIEMDENSKNILRTNGRKFVEKHLSWDTIAEQFKNEIKKVI